MVGAEHTPQELLSISQAAENLRRWEGLVHEEAYGRNESQVPGTMCRDGRMDRVPAGVHKTAGNTVESCCACTRCGACFLFWSFNLSAMIGEMVAG